MTAVVNVQNLPCSFIQHKLSWIFKTSESAYFNHGLGELHCKVSVILQVASYKLTKRRIFRMAPIHHHFELKGWAEPKVIVRFWIITVCLVLVGLATLKVR